MLLIICDKTYLEIFFPESGETLEDTGEGYVYF